MHGAEFYANTRHKGNHYDGNGGNGGNNNGAGLHFDPNTPRSVSTVKSELDTSPASHEDQLSNGSNGGGGQQAHDQMAPQQQMLDLGMPPLSDSNISTTCLASAVNAPRSG